ncbi:MAG: GmrSD restriction endonuclease domain-containing protein [Anaerolineaceae bacterium]
MSKTLFKEVSYSLSKIIEDIDMGEIGLPELQRPFVWPNTKVRDLFDSMYRGFPVGYLLFWANGVTDGHKTIGGKPKPKIPRLLIVDGQQRLTSLYAVLKGIEVLRENFRHERIFIAFNPREQTFEVADAAIQRDPEWIADISLLWSSDIPRNRFVKEFLKKLRSAHEVSDVEEDALTENIDRLYDLHDYPFTALELSATVDEEAVADVFVRINSKGTILNQADFILTLMSVFWDEGRAALEEFSRLSRLPSITGPSPFNYYIHPYPDQLIRVDMGLGFGRARLRHVYNLLRGKDLDTGVFSAERRDAQFAILQEAQKKVLDVQNWHSFLKTLRAAGYISQSMMTSQTALLYTYVFFLLGKIEFQVDHHELRKSIARWFFMSTLTGRYTGSFESTMEQDLARFREVKDAQGFLSILNRVSQDTLTEDFWAITLPNDLATSSPRSPSLFAYYASLNLLHANVLFSKLPVAELLDPAIKAKKSATERHHLFPKGYLAELGIRDLRDTNQIANYALVEWDDNIGISDAPPSDYFPKYTPRFTSSEIKQMMYWHALPEGWEKMNYFDFLENRRKMISKIIRDGFNKLG